MSLGNWLQIVQIINGIVTTVAIIAAAAWFFWRRAPARSLQITLTLAGVAMINNTKVAIIRVQLKNNGLTRIKTERTRDEQKSVSYYLRAREVEASGRDPITPLVIRGFDSGRIPIFKKIKELEPNEVVSEDVPLALKINVFEVHVEFHAERGMVAWSATAVFNADEQMKSSSTINLPTKQAASSG